MGQLYRVFRRWVIAVFYLKQSVLFQKRDLEPAVEFGDKLYAFLYRYFRRLVFVNTIPKGIGVDFCGLHFPSPFTFAAFKSDMSLIQAWLDLGMGGGCVKTLMLEPRAGNPRPRLLEIKQDGKKGLINALGLPGPGIETACKQVKRHYLARYKRPIGFSIGGGSSQEYFVLFKKVIAFCKEEDLSNMYVELNLSCPNTEDGQALLENTDDVIKLLDLFREHSSCALGIKLAPHLKDSVLLDYATRLKGYKNVFLNCGNTQMMAHQGISVARGGLSGEPLFKRSLAIAKLLKPIGVPLMITGGITKFEHIQLLKQEGVSLFGLATALIENPFQLVSWNQRV